MIRIEEVNINEIQKVKKFLSHVWKKTYGDIYPPEIIEKITSIWHNPKVLTKQVIDPNTFFTTAKDQDGKIIGLITARRINDKTVHLG